MLTLCPGILPTQLHLSTAWARWLLGENCHRGADNTLALTTQPCTGAAVSGLLTLGFFRLEKKLSRSRAAFPLFSHITLHMKQVSLNLELIYCFAAIFFCISPVYRKTSSGILFYIYYLSTGRGPFQE